MTVWLSLMAAISIAILVVALTLQVRWRRRTRSERDAVRDDLARVHRAVGKGGPVSESDHLAAVLDVEQHVLFLPNGIALLLLAAATSFNAGTTPAGTTFRYAVGGLIAASALVSFTLIGRYVLTARRQGIRPRSLWQ